MSLFGSFHIAAVTERYEILDNIGIGGQATVRRARDRMTNRIVAVKETDIPDKDEGVPSSIIREISIMKEMEHENIIRLLDVVSSEEKVYLIFECMEIDLNKFMESKPAIAKDPRLIKKFLHQVLSGVAYCHSHRILHRDLKPHNMLIDSSSNVLKIADFGVARHIGVPQSSYSRDFVTLFYAAPEILLGSKQYSDASDIWSVGCLFAEMVIHVPLFEAPGLMHFLAKLFSIMGTPTEETWPGVTSFWDFQDSYNNIEPKNLADLVPGLEEAGFDLLTRMLCMNPSGRITAYEALKHEYFNDI